MKLLSYNITDVGYHYIGLRVLANPVRTGPSNCKPLRVAC